LFDVRLDGLEGPAAAAEGSSRLCRFASGLPPLLVWATLVRFAAERVRVIVTSTTGVSRFVGEDVAFRERRGVVDIVMCWSFVRKSKQVAQKGRHLTKTQVDHSAIEVLWVDWQGQLLVAQGHAMTLVQAIVSHSLFR